MKKRLVLVVTGTRAEFGYLRPLLKEIQKSRTLEFRLLVTGIHTLKHLGYTLNEVRKEMPVAAVVSIKKNDTMLQSLAKEIKGIETYCKKERPDMILSIADRDENFAGAIVAGHMGIPLVHISGGSTTGFGVDEAIRHSITKFAHVHFVWTKNNAKRLRAMGEESWRIHVSGSTAYDSLAAEPLYSRRELASLLHLRETAPWFIVLQHPTPLDQIPLAKQLSPTLKSLYNHDADRVIIYPNSDTGSIEFVKEIDALKEKPNTFLHKTLSHRIFLSLLAHADVLIGNSSSGIEEAGYFHLPVVDIGGRQKGRECGANVIHVPYNQKAIEGAIRTALSPTFIKIAKNAKHPYFRGNASKKIVKVLERLHLDERLKYKHIPM